MEFYWVVTLFQVHLSSNLVEKLKQRGFEEFSCLGVEEYALSEAEVDAILGERSYSGGDLPLEVLEEVEMIQSQSPVNIRFFFDEEHLALKFEELIKKEILCEAQAEKVKSEDWNAEWKKHYSSIVVNSNLKVIPSWEQEEGPSKNTIKIYPGMGFGTGSHETTFLCLKLFEEKTYKNSLKTVLDFGSGSGILGIASLKMCDEVKVDFYDIDVEANKNCYQNIELNLLENLQFRLLLPEYKNVLLPSYDLIFANILQNILIEEAEFLVSRLSVGGSMILSGLLNHQVDEVINLYSTKGMKLNFHLNKGDWSALLMEKIK